MSDEAEEAVHEWFGLTYASFMVLPRVALQSMPPEWQRRFIAMVSEIEQTLELPEEIPSAYRVTRIDAKGRYLPNPWPYYNRGRTRLPLKERDAR